MAHVAMRYAKGMDPLPVPGQEPPQPQYHLPAGFFASAIESLLLYPLGMLSREPTADLLAGADQIWLACCANDMTTRTGWPCSRAEQ
jgi:hypothetical protein